MLIDFYVCDSHNCKAFDQAAKKGERGTEEYVLALLGEFGNDGIWPLPYIGAAILTPISLWFIGDKITVKNYAIVFFVSFFVFYALLAFFMHHYAKFISKYVQEYIQNDDNTTNSTILEKMEKIINQNENILKNCYYVDDVYQPNLCDLGNRHADS